MDIYDKQYDGDCGINPYRSDVVEKFDGVGFDRETREFRKTEMKFKADVFKCLKKNKQRALNRFNLKKSDEDNEIDFSDILLAYLIWLPKIANESRELALQALYRAYGREIPKHILESVTANDTSALEAHARNMVARSEEYTKRKVEEMEQKALSNDETSEQYETKLNETTLFSVERAATISSTEIFAVSVAASDAIFKTSGMSFKKWNVYPGCCKACGDNAAMGWIDVNQSFASGGFRPPLHPRCRCDVRYRTLSSLAGVAGGISSVNEDTNNESSQEE